jgi:hypothetical protein
VNFQTGLTGMITLTTGELRIGKDLSIVGPGAGNMVISGNHTSRVFAVAANVHVAVAGLTMVAGQTNSPGGGISNAGTLLISDSVVSGNSTIASPYAYGGGIANSGDLTLSDSTVVGNSAIGGTTGVGGGIYNYGALAILNSAVIGNGAGPANYGYGLGGGVYNAGALTITSSTINGNSSGSAAGGVYDAYGTVIVRDSSISGNTTGGQGGGLYNYSGIVAIVGSVVAANTAYSEGGGIANGGTLSVSSSTIAGNTGIPPAGGGGGIFNLGNGFANIANCTISSNSARTGGGIENLNRLTLLNSTLSGNAAEQGGGMDDQGTMTTITNCTISGNAAGDQGGGGINFLGQGEIVITNSTISNNSSTRNSGGCFGAVTIRNTIIAGNSAVSAPDVGGTEVHALRSLGHNLVGIGDGSSGFADTDLVGTSERPLIPLLGPLQDNGGPTQTMALLPGSPAVDAGDKSNTPVPARARDTFLHGRAAPGSSGYTL